MDEKLILLKNYIENNEILRNTFKFKQRFKLTCFDVSTKYLVFGASNGSLYIFKRHPCEFLNLIPSRNGIAVTEIAISPDENHIALSEPTGLFTILENFFDGANFQCHNFFEHKGSILTSLKWQENKLYVGDKEGKIGMATFPDLLSKTILQMPYVSLMNLGNQIMQIEPFGKFLLVTTLHRTYLCDTDREVYKKIGKNDKKAKSNGGCFFFLKGDLISEIKIFCSKPRAQFWEANLEGEVIFTQKYKTAALDLKEIVCINQTNIEKIKIDHNEVNFGKVYLFNERFLITVESTSFHIIDPIKSKILLRYIFEDIVDIKITKNEVWIFDYKTEKIKVFSIYNIKDAVIWLNNKENFDLCLKLSLNFKNEILKIAEDVDFPLNLKDIANKCSNKEFTNEIEWLIDDFNELKIKKEKEFKDMMSEKEIVYKNQSEAEADFTIEKKIPTSYQIIFSQFKLNESHDLAETAEYKKLIDNLDINELCGLFLSCIEFFKTTDPKIQNWCSIRFLSQLSTENINNLNDNFKSYALDSFLQINKSLSKSCTCGYPLPKAKEKVPIFYDIACKLIEGKNLNQEYLQKVPYLWRTYLENSKNFESDLSAILQFGDLNILKKYSNQILFDICDVIVNLVLKLKKGVCLNCEQKFDEDNVKNVIGWNKVGCFLIPLIGSENVLKLFLYRAKDIKNEELGMEFYQMCIFAKSTFINCGNDKEFRENAVLIAEKLSSDSKTNNLFGKSMKEFLENKIEPKPTSGKKILNFGHCLYCNLPLNNEILNLDLVNSNCGHQFHKICFKYIESSCNFCATKDSNI